jgi:putative Holliday junction resolvase
MRYLGLDLGTRTLGISISETGVIARNYDVIRHNEEYDHLVNVVKDIVKKENIDVVVLGFPKNMNKSIGIKGNLSIDFKEKLEKKINIPIYLQDERLTTVIANNTLIQGDVSRKNRKKVVDSVAATIILQDYLNGKG